MMIIVINCQVKVEEKYRQTSNQIDYDDDDDVDNNNTGLLTGSKNVLKLHRRKSCSNRSGI